MHSRPVHGPAAPGAALRTCQCAAGPELRRPLEDTFEWLRGRLADVLEEDLLALLATHHRLLTDDGQVSATRARGLVRLAGIGYYGRVAPGSSA